MNRCLLFLLTLFVVGLSVANAADKQVTGDDFPKLYGEFKAVMAKMAQLRVRAQSDPGADRKQLQKEFEELLKSAEQLQYPLCDSAELAYAAAPNKDPELAEFLIQTLGGYIQEDNYERGTKLAHMLLENKCENNSLDLLAGLTFFMTNDFEEAEKHLAAAKERGATNEHGNRYLGLAKQYQTLWAKEKEIRAAEEKAGNLPKVKLETSKGTIVIELFENEAPNTTANFIDLVSKKYYDGLTFHRVIPGFMAQGGDPQGTGAGGPGYTIPDELGENHRKHFRGSLSMAKTAAPNSGGSQFFLTFVPTTHLDGKHTVFGRVVDGMDVLSKIQRTEGVPGATPDKIIKATVIAKRNHKYVPVTRPDAG